MPLSARTKFAYGLGQVAETVKTTGFDLFLFFYFTQVLGLAGSLAGIAVMIALAFDAITDPLAGRLSDGWRSPRGRRHPFMFAAAVPLALAWFGLFMPPQHMGQLGLFVWLTAFAMLVRGSMTLYYVPYLALGAELTDDYHERTSVAAWRGISGVLGATPVILIGIPLFFPDTAEFENGLLNPAGYPKVAVSGAVIMALAILASAWGTRDRIALLARAPEIGQRTSLREDARAVWANVSFRALFIGTLLVAVAIGMVQTLNVHLNVYFWRLPSSAIAFLATGALFGWIVGIVLARPMHRRFDKKPTIIGAALTATVAGNIAVAAKLAGVFPEQGSALFVPLILVLLFIGGVASGMAIITGGSMMADVAHQQAMRTGQNQEGFLFSAIAFTGKLAVAVGYLVAGVGLDLIEFPLQAEPSEVSDQAVVSLAWLNLSACLFGFVSVYAYRYYRITAAQAQTVIAPASLERTAVDVIAP